MIKRGWFTNNTTWHGHLRDSPEVGKSRRDFGGFSLMGICIRTLNWWWCWPVLWVLDLDLAFGAIRHRYFSDTDDVLNHVVRSCISHGVLPTPVSWLANKINNPDNLGVRLITYFDREFNFTGEIDTGPPMYIVYDADLLRRVMG